MTSFKDSQISRPTSQHRFSMSSTSGSSLPVRQAHSRNHSHSLSLGSVNPTHRVTRRKSISSAASGNVAALAAALKEAGEQAFPLSSNRRSVMSKNSSGSKSTEPTSKGGKYDASNYPSPPGSLPNQTNGFDGHQHSGFHASSSSAVADGPPMASEGNSTHNHVARTRRASEGAHLIKGDKKTNGSDLKCDKCGKGYKHSSCLTKHLWEHTPEWSYTSKLLISKHQQVQLLEAASVLVAMNQDGPTAQENTKAMDSDHSSASPPASGSSEHRDDASSTNTTPPPQVEDLASVPVPNKTSRGGRPKRYSSNNSYSRSYQSAPSNALHAGSAPSHSPGFPPYRQGSVEQRPSTSGTSVVGPSSGDEDEASLAAALELLSSSFGTPRSGPVMLPSDVPPVPPLPARFLGQNQSSFSGTTATPSAHPAGQRVSNTSHRASADEDVEMAESEESVYDDEDFDHRSSSRGRSDEDYDGVFGGMEE